MPARGARGEKLADGKYEKLSIGTTTSSRMDRFAPGLMEKYKVRAIDENGGLLLESMESMQKFGGVYLAIVGGAAANETCQIEKIEEVWWEDLMPERLWKFRVKNFGPLVAAMDSKANSLYQAV
jgi:L(+)-tartrate dehydratase beta subunit